MPDYYYGDLYVSGEGIAPYTGPGFTSVTTPEPTPSVTTPPTVTSDPTYSPPITSLVPTVSQTPTPGQGIAATTVGGSTTALPTSVPATAIQAVNADPENPVVGQIWYRTDTSQLSIRHDSGTTKRVVLA